MYVADFYPSRTIAPRFNPDLTTNPAGRLHTIQADAINMLMDLRAKISTQEDFAEIAEEHSDCGSARSGGDLGEFGEGQMMKVGNEPGWVGRGGAATGASFTVVNVIHLREVFDVDTTAVHTCMDSSEDGRESTGKKLVVFPAFQRNVSYCVFYAGFTVRKFCSCVLYRRGRYALLFFSVGSCQDGHWGRVGWARGEPRKMQGSYQKLYVFD